MNAKFKKFHDRSGVTLVELLVVILIVTILAVGLLPVFKKFVVEAQYAAAPISVVGHLCTQIALYQYEHNALPGVDGSVQTYVFASGTTDASKARVYETAQFALGTISAKLAIHPAKAYGAGNDSAFFLKQMDLKSDSAVSSKMNPRHVQYVKLAGGSGASYAYAIGVFGNGDGLPQGTGYAVFEGFFPNVGADGTKVIGSWKNYTGKDTEQILFGDSGSNPDFACILDERIITVAQDQPALNGSLTGMEAGGWVFNN